MYVCVCECVYVCLLQSTMRESVCIYTDAYFLPLVYLSVDDTDSCCLKTSKQTNDVVLRSYGELQCGMFAYPHIQGQFS